MNQVYKVTTEGDCEGRTRITLGYATGSPELIQEYFRGQKMYEIRVEAITIHTVEGADLERRVSLKKEREELRQRIESIEKELSNRQDEFRQRKKSIDEELGGA